MTSNGMTVKTGTGWAIVSSLFRLASNQEPPGEQKAIDSGALKERMFCAEETLFEELATMMHAVYSVGFSQVWLETQLSILVRQELFRGLFTRMITLQSVDDIDRARDLSRSIR